MPSTLPSRPRPECFTPPNGAAAWSASGTSPRRHPSRSSRLVAVSIARDELIEILAEADPVGLIASGAPRDEYAAEADAILALRGVPRLAEITGIFAVSFSEPGACPRDTARWIVEEMARRTGQ